MLSEGVKKERGRSKITLKLSRKTYILIESMHMQQKTSILYCDFLEWERYKQQRFVYPTTYLGSMPTAMLQLYVYFL